MPTPSPTGLPTSQPSWPLTPDPTGVPTKAPNSSGVAPLAGLYGPWGDGQFLVERLVTFCVEINRRFGTSRPNFEIL
jgi:hypothetical protein